MSPTLSRPPETLSRWLFLTLLAFLTLPAAGCVTFEKETMVFAFPRDKDEVRVLLVYEGINGQGTNEQALKEARDQLARFVNSGEEFCLGDNWLTHIVLTPSTNEDAASRAFADLARKHLKVKNGAFFVDKEGRLCGYQVVTLSDARKFVTDLNDLLNPAIDKAVSETLADPKKRDNGMDEETLRLIQRAARAKATWVRLEPGRVAFTLPLSPALLRKQRETFVESLEKDEKGRASLFSIIRQTPVSIDQRKNHFTVALGVGESEPFTVNATNMDKEKRGFEKELIEHARSLRPEFRKGVTTEMLVEEFLHEANGERKK